MLSHLRHWFQHIASRLPALIPSSCALCGIDADHAICDACQTQFFGALQHRCTQCAIPLPQMTESTAARCGDCLSQAPAFDATLVAADYAAPIDQLVLALKFGNRLALAPLFARMLRDAMLRINDDTMPLPTHLVAVPLGAQRLADRGFNQALEIAKPLGRTLGIPLLPNVVKRLRDTEAQALLHPDERRKNILHAFTIDINAVEGIRGKHIGVVDDVMTTGETLNEMAATLKRFGATRVTNFVFARTQQK